MKFIVANTKGGVGKSTTATQLLVPYLHEKLNDKVNLIELDDENLDSKSFANSEILKAEQIKVAGGDLEGNLIEKVLGYDNFVMDVGGNKTTTIVLNEVGELGLIDTLDAIFIPLTDGEQDAINAYKTYRLIKDFNPNIKTFFVLSRVDENMDLELQFIDFFGDLKGRINGKKGIIEQIKVNDRNVLKMTNSDVIKYSRLFATTAYEISKFDVKALQEKQKEYIRNKENEKAIKVTYRIQIVKKAQKYYNNILKPAFARINEIMGG